MIKWKAYKILKRSKEELLSFLWKNKKYSQMKRLTIPIPNNIKASLKGKLKLKRRQQTGVNIWIDKAKIINTSNL